MVVIETGAGVRNANTYVDRSFVTTYLADRGRSSENRWSSKSTAAQDAAVVAATDYIEKRWGQRFRGSRLVSFDDVKAEGQIVFTGLPSNAEALTLGDITYTFVSSLTDGNSNEVLIGTDAATMATNLLNALEKDSDTDGATHEGVLEANRHVSATRTSGTLDLVAVADGVGGNDTALSTAATNTSVTAFSGGLDGGSQPLSFPRHGLVDASGIAVEGIPRPLKEATAEYAVRAVAAALAPDPNVDAQGASVTKLREKIGPIETETEYLHGSHLSDSLKPYPEADRLLGQYVRAAGAVIR